MPNKLHERMIWKPEDIDIEGRQSRRAPAKPVVECGGKGGKPGPCPSGINKDVEPGAVDAAAKATEKSEPRLFKDDPEIEEWGKTHYSAWASSLNKDEFDSVRSYTGDTGDDYKAINGFARRTTADLSDADATPGVLGKKIRAIDAALAKSSVPEDVMVYRDLEKNPGLKEGTIFKDKAFVSTSLAREQAENFAAQDGVIIEIKVRKGAKGAYIDRISKTSGEQELLLPRSSNFKVIGSREESSTYGKRTIYTVEVA